MLARTRHRLKSHKLLPKPGQRRPYRTTLTITLGKYPFQTTLITIQLPQGSNKILTIYSLESPVHKLRQTLQFPVPSRSHKIVGCTVHPCHQLTGLGYNHLPLPPSHCSRQKSRYFHVLLLRKSMGYHNGVTCYKPRLVV